MSHLGTIENNKFIQSLDGIAVAGIGLVILILVIGLSILISRKNPKVNQFFIKVKNMIFWNFLIRYFQVSFIGMNYQALLAISESRDGYKEIALSIVILILQYLVVCIIA